MLNFLRRKAATGTPLDVLEPIDTDLRSDFGDDETPELTADEAYDTLPDLAPRPLVRKSVPAGELIARVRAERVA